jgi:hypothetical protein
MAITMRARYLVEKTNIDAGDAESFIAMYSGLSDDEAVWCVAQGQALGRYRPEMAQWFADFLMRSRDGNWDQYADELDN